MHTDSQTGASSRRLREDQITEKNAEVRREIVRKIGIEKICKDLKAKTTRDELAATVQNKIEYFQKLQMQLTFFVNPTDQIKRISELSNKTNQFNTSFLRFSELDIANKIKQLDIYQIITVQLNDILTDSGIIAAIFFMKEDSILTTEDIVISCRALGRNIEMYILDL